MKTTIILTRLWIAGVRTWPSAEGDQDQVGTITVSGTATSGTDYTALSGTVTIPADASSQTVQVEPLADSEADGRETLIVTVGTDTAYQVGSASTATVTIGDLPISVVSLIGAVPLASEAGSEEGGPETGVVFVTRWGGTEDSLTVYYTVSGTATAGTDYTALSGSVTIPAGESLGVLSIEPIADNLVEGPETVLITLQADLAYRLDTAAEALVTIADTPLPQVSLFASQPNAAEKDPVSGAAQPGTFTISRTGSTTWALTVAYTVSGSATAGTDYTALSGTVTIPADASAITLTITPLQDDEREGDETVIVTLDSAAGYLVRLPAGDIVSIADAPLPTVDIYTSRPTADEATAWRGANPGVFTVSRTGDLGDDLTVHYTLSGTATAGSDYAVLSGSVTIPAGAADAMLLISPVDTHPGTPDRTVVITLDSDAAYEAGASTTDTITVRSPALGLTLPGTRSASASGPAGSAAAGGSAGSTASLPGGPPGSSFSLASFLLDEYFAQSVHLVESGTALAGTFIYDETYSSNYTIHEEAVTAFGPIKLDDGAVYNYTLHEQGTYDAGIFSLTSYLFTESGTVSLGSPPTVAYLAWAEGNPPSTGTFVLDEGWGNHFNNHQEISGLAGTYTWGQGSSSSFTYNASGSYADATFFTSNGGTHTLDQSASNHNDYSETGTFTLSSDYATASASGSYTSDRGSAWSSDYAATGSYQNTNIYGTNEGTYTQTNGASAYDGYGESGTFSKPSTGSVSASGTYTLSQGEHQWSTYTVSAGSYSYSDSSGSSNQGNYSSDRGDDNQVDFSESGSFTADGSTSTSADGTYLLSRGRTAHYSYAATGSFSSVAGTNSDSASYTLTQGDDQHANYNDSGTFTNSAGSVHLDGSFTRDDASNPYYTYAAVGSFSSVTGSNSDMASYSRDDAYAAHYSYNVQGTYTSDLGTYTEGGGETFSQGYTEDHNYTAEGTFTTSVPSSGGSQSGTYTLVRANSFHRNYDNSDTYTSTAGISASDSAGGSYLLDEGYIIHYAYTASGNFSNPGSSGSSDAGTFSRDIGSDEYYSYVESGTFSNSFGPSGSTLAKAGSDTFNEGFAWHDSSAATGSYTISDSYGEDNGSYTREGGTGADYSYALNEAFSRSTASTAASDSSSGSFTLSLGSHDSYHYHATGSYADSSSDGSASDSASYTIDDEDKSDATSSRQGTFTSDSPGTMSSTGSYSWSSGRDGHSNTDVSDGSFTKTFFGGSDEGSYSRYAHVKWHSASSESGTFTKSAGPGGDTSSKSGKRVVDRNDEIHFQYNATGTFNSDDGFGNSNSSTYTRDQGSNAHYIQGTTAIFTESTSPAGSSSTSAGTYLLDRGNDRHFAYNAAGSMSTDDAHGKTTSGTFIETESESSGQSQATSGSYSTSSGAAGSSQSMTGTYTQDDTSNNSSSYQATGSYSIDGVGGTFTSDQGSSGTYAFHDKGTLSSSGSVTQVGTFTRDTESAWHDNGTRHRSSATGTMNLDRAETSTNKRHEDGKRYGPSNLRVVGFSRDDHYLYESTRHDDDSFSTPAGDTYSSETWSTDDFVTAHTDYHASGSTSLLGTYSFDSYSYDAGSSGHSERYSIRNMNEGTITIDGTSSFTNSVQQSGTGIFGTFMQDSNREATYHWHMVYADGHPDDDYTAPPLEGQHLHFEGTIDLASGTAIVTSWAGGVVGASSSSSWWGTFTAWVSAAWNATLDFIDVIGNFALETLNGYLEILTPYSAPDPTTMAGKIGRGVGRGLGLTQATLEMFFGLLDMAAGAGGVGGGVVLAFAGTGPIGLGVSAASAGLIVVGAGEYAHGAYGWYRFGQVIQNSGGGSGGGGGSLGGSSAPNTTKQILDGLPGKTGKTGPIKSVPDATALDDLFNSLTSGGKTVNPGTYPGIVKELSDGTIIRRRPGSKSGGATLDITMPDGKIYKVHIQ